MVSFVFLIIVLVILTKEISILFILKEGLLNISTSNIAVIMGLVKYQPTLAPGVDRSTWFVFIHTFMCWRHTYWHIFFPLIFHLCWNPTAITIVRINYLSLSMSQSDWNKHSVIREDHIYVTVTPCLRMKDNLLMSGLLKSEVSGPSDK